MYKNFRRNLNNYLEANKNGSKEEFRLKIIEPFKILSNVNTYNRMKKKNSLQIQEVNNLVYEINKQKTNYRPFKQFAWELWLCGFESQESSCAERNIINEQLKILKLLLGTQYWKD